MTFPVALVAADLAVLIATATFGFASLLAWARHRAAGFPRGRIATHVTLQTVSIGLWIAHLATGLPALAWITFVVITAGQVLGDLLMLASYRARHPGAARVSYRAAASDVLSFRRTAPALHATVGAIAWFGMLAICIVETVT